MDTKLFDALWGENEGIAEIRTISPKQPVLQEWFPWPSDKERFIKYADKLKNGINIYFGVCLRSVQSGDKEAVKAIPAFWCDVDFKATKEIEAKRLLATFKLPPSAIIHSGGGWHLYWILKEPITSFDHDSIRFINLRIAAQLGGDPGACDTARILRFPGTFNFKYSNPIPEVRLIDLNDRRYNASDFDYLPNPDAEREAKKTMQLPEIIADGSRNTVLTSWAGVLRDKGATEDIMLASLLAVNQTCQTPLGRDEVESIVKSVGRYIPKRPIQTQPLQNNIQINFNGDDPPAPTKANATLWEKLGLALSKQGNPLTNMDNVIRIFRGVEAFDKFVWFDEFHNKYFTTWNSKTPKEWSDIDDVNLTYIIQREFGLGRMSVDTVHQAIVVYANQHVRNEPKDWMESLRWDNTDRIGGILHAFLGCEANAYTMAADRNFWISMVARVYKPGCQVDNMIVLEGRQGIGKTNALRAIGGKWYSEAQESVTSKDFFMTLQGKFIVEIAELDSFSKAEVARIKQVITSKFDRYRPPYGRIAQDFPRQCVFVGTTNDNHYLRDNTGARRFWPIKCGKIDIDAIYKYREQCFAEAIHLFKQNASWYQMPEGVTQQEQEARRMTDVWEESIEEYLENRDTAQIRDVAENCLNLDISKLDMNIQKRIGATLRRLGFEKKVARSNGKLAKIWFKTPIESVM